jgi:hypothetical protein
LNKNIWIGLSSPYGLSLKNIEIKRKQTKYKNKIITKKTRKENQTNQTQNKYNKLIIYFFLLGAIWFGLSSPYGLKNLQIKRKQMTYKKEQITTRKQKKANKYQNKTKNKKQIKKNNIS